MSEAAATAGFRGYEAIAEELCEAIAGPGKAPGFAEKLYGTAQIEDQEIRELTEINRDETAKLIDAVREKLDATSCELVHQEQQQHNYIVHFRVNGKTLVEAFIDDLYEQDGRILARDQIRFRPLEPEAQDESDEADEADESDETDKTDA
jgi:hypothetical protein